MNDNTEETIT